LPAAVLVSIGCSVALRGGALLLHGAYGVLQVTDAAGEPIDARDHQHVALAQEGEQSAKLLTASGAGAAPPL
jgi:hypothetical protein